MKWYDKDSHHPKSIHVVSGLGFLGVRIRVRVRVRVSKFRVFYRRPDPTPNRYIQDTVASEADNRKPFDFSVDPDTRQMTTRMPTF